MPIQFGRGTLPSPSLVHGCTVEIATPARARMAFEIYPRLNQAPVAPDQVPPAARLSIGKSWQHDAKFPHQGATLPFQPVAPPLPPFLRN